MWPALLRFLQFAKIEHYDNFCFAVAATKYNISYIICPNFYSFVTWVRGLGGEAGESFTSTQ